MTLKELMIFIETNKMKGISKSESKKQFVKEMGIYHGYIDRDFISWMQDFDKVWGRYE